VLVSETFGEVAAVKRKTPKRDWLLYPCVVRRTFGMFCFLFILCYFNSYSQYNYCADSYEASCARENISVVQSDINSASKKILRNAIEITGQQNDSRQMHHMFPAVMPVV